MSLTLPMLHDRGRVNIVEPGRLHPAVSFARASTATYMGPSGTLLTAAINAPRYEYDSIGNYLGLLIEEARTNNALNSATLVTQTRTVTAVAQTLSFYGTGTVTLSGVATGTLVGTGASNRVTLTFTPTAGSLTLTVTGSCTNGQLEAGAFVTSYIPTTTAAVTRSADVAQVTGLTKIGFNAAAGTLVGSFSSPSLTSATRTVFTVGSAGNNTYNLARLSTGISSQVYAAGSVSANMTTLTPFASNVGYSTAFAYAVNDFAASTNGGAIVTDTSGSLPAGLTQANIGSNFGLEYLNGHIGRITYYPLRRQNAELQRLST